MVHKFRFTQFIFATIIAACLNGSLLAAPGTERAPAGQMCPGGSYVIGFDSEANIICSEACGNGVLKPGDTCDDEDAVSGDVGAATSQPEGVKPESTGQEITTQAIQADTGVSTSTPKPIISDIKPSKLVFGTRELAITISGTGFHAGSTIIFEGSIYSPSVNQAGTQLKVTIPTRTLSIGPYAITVSNESGMEATLKRALEIY